MPNICSYSMRVRGKKENVETFYNWLSSAYDYSEENKGIKVWRVEEGKDAYYGITEEDKIPSEHHIGYRVFEAYKDWEHEKSGEYVMGISGDCAWSVFSCMFEGHGSYISDTTYGRPDDKVISIPNASKELGVQVEIFSEESGMCFSEHYYINKGEIELNNESEFTELWLDYFDKNSEAYEERAYEELSDDMKEKVNQAIANGEDVLTECDNIDDDGNYIWNYITD